MRVKLHPENLGELHVRVITSGNQVGLQIQASDEKAKKILEESMSHLKDSLASHSLALGSIEVTVAPQSSSSGEMKQEHQQSRQDMMGQSQSNMNQSGQGGSQNSYGSVENDVAGGRSSMRAMGGSAALSSRAAESSRPSVAANGRLDVRA